MKKAVLTLAMAALSLYPQVGAKAIASVKRI